MAIEKPETPEEVEATTVEEAEDGGLEDMELSFDDQPDNESEEESAEESEDESGEDTEDEEAGETEDTEEESNEEAESVEEDQEEELATQPEVDQQADEQKRRNDEYAKQRIAERNERERLKRESQMDYLNKAEDDKDLALRQLQIDAYNNRVESNKSKLQSSLDRAVASIDLFTEGSPEVKQMLVQRAAQFEAANVSYDRNGDPTEVRGDLYEYLKNEADSIRRLIDVGARQNTKSKAKVRAKTTPRPSATPKQPKVDPDIEAFDEEVNSYWDE